MCNQKCEYKFKVENLLTEHQVKDKNIQFYSPQFPSTEKAENYTEGKLTFEFYKYQIVKEGLELVFALNNRLSRCVEITDFEEPGGSFGGWDVKCELHVTGTLEDAESIPNLWNKYLKLQQGKHQELKRSIQWFMRAIKSEDPIDKFIYSWITFNMLYGWLTCSKYHNKGIKGLTGKGIPCPVEDAALQIRIDVGKRLGIFQRLSEITIGLGGLNPKYLAFGKFRGIFFEIWT